MSPPSSPLDRLQNGPILSTLLRLSLPNVLAMVMTVAVGIAETYYVGHLGTAPLAAMALVFPFAMLSGMLSAGAMGGGVSSAISRALGAADLPRANQLALHALLIGTVAGVVYSALFLALGPMLYRLLGGTGTVLDEAARYSAVLFSGALLVWLSNTLASVLRGTGNMRVPSVGIFATAILQIVLGGLFGLGAGPIPAMGMPGIAIGHIIATGAGVVYFAWFLWAGKSRLSLRLRALHVQRTMLHDILRVGAVAMISPLQSVLTVLIFTGLIARLGTEALAGYGIGQRLEFLLIPISFGIGVASVPMVGMAIGAGKVTRARRVAWTAAALSALNLAAIGLWVSVAPTQWAGLFTSDAAVLQLACQYLVTAGPAFAFFGMGLTLYFASQGSGKVLGPVIAGTLRLALVAGVGSWLATQGHGADAYFWLVAAAMVLYGLSTVALVRMTPWARA
ncbi:MATE family efflux transporter [Limnohabitans sp.]|uniref:MATE family efflux transporter n=1 Tax=Limnohabitans sp. TaxID=1907725 RepID=UPI0035B39E40